LDTFGCIYWYRNQTTIIYKRTETMSSSKTSKKRAASSSKATTTTTTSSSSSAATSPAATTTSTKKLKKSSVAPPTLFEIQHTAVVSLGTFPRQDCPKLFPAALKEIASVLEMHKIERSGKNWVTHHVTCQPETFTVDVHVPIEKKLPKGRGNKNGRVQAGSLNFNVLKKTYVGRYEKLHDAWCTFTDEVDASEYKPKGSILEHYLIDYATTKDESKFVTELMTVV
jgi:effector-binding domain-containing protein